MIHGIAEIGVLIHTLLKQKTDMDIEIINRKIIASLFFRVDKNENSRSSINHELINRLKEIWREKGFPTESDYKKHISKIKIKKHEEKNQ